MKSHKCLLGTLHWNHIKHMVTSASTFQQVVFGHPLTTKRLFIDTSWKVLVFTVSCLLHPRHVGMALYMLDVLGPPSIRFLGVPRSPWD